MTLGRGQGTAKKNEAANRQGKAILKVKVAERDRRPDEQACRAAARRPHFSRGHVKFRLHSTMAGRVRAVKSTFEHKLENQCTLARAQ